ncbi:MAG TPA: hypothetical protein VK206_24585 [Anaerolineales bacterium]|nr:hypothetical protein [Anaerolineales bacterium]
MLQIFFEIYLVLSLAAALLLWMALAVSRMDEVEEGQDRQRFYQIAWEISNPKNTRYGKE